MKVICVIGALDYGGAERVIINIANFLSLKHDVTLVALHKRDNISYAIDKKVNVVNGLNFNNKIDSIYKLRILINEINPNVILSFLTHVNIVSIIASVGTNCPVIVSERNDPRRNISFIRRQLRNLIYPFASGYVFQTEDAASCFSKQIKDKSVIIPNPIFIEKDLKDYYSEDRKKIIVSVGRLVKQKNFEMLIKAFANIIEVKKDYKLLIYGEGPERQNLEKLIEHFSIGNKIELCGTSNRLHYEIKDAEIFVMTSDYEGMPNVLMEAMALGLCCISTDCPVGGPRMLINNGVNGFLYPVGGQKELEVVLKDVMFNGQKRQIVGRNARNIYNAMNPEIVLQKWEKFLVANSRKI